MSSVEGRLKRARQGGFALIEGLLAVVLLSATVVLINSALGSGWHGLRRSGDAQAATAIAMAQLAAAGRETELRESSSEGDEQGYRWRVAVTRHMVASVVPANERHAAWRVTVTVSWQDHALSGTRSVELETVKLAEARR